MEGSARVESLDAIRDFKIALAKFIEVGNGALSDAESELNRTASWLDPEQDLYWQGQIRQRADKLAQAQDKLREKQLFKDSTGRTPSAIEEQKAVAVAKRRLEESQQKLQKVRQHSRRMQKTILLYKGQVQRMTTSLTGDLPAAIAHLSNLLQSLDAYVALAASAGESAPESTGELTTVGTESGASMAREVAEEDKVESGVRDQESGADNQNSRVTQDKPKS
jgi:hypothetical protein